MMPQQKKPKPHSQRPRLKVVGIKFKLKLKNKRPGISARIYLFPCLFHEISITNHHCFIEEPMPTEKAKRGRGKKAQSIDNILAEEQMVQVPTKAEARKPLLLKRNLSPPIREGLPVLR